MFGDFPRIVTEGLTIPENSVHKIIFVKICVWSSDSSGIARVIQVELLVFDH